MSEYQYYEFRAVDRPLTKGEMAKLRAVSTRAQISPTRFVNEYNWGDFKGDPVAWMEMYFDAFLYFANWGTRWLMLRIPESAVDSDTLSEYAYTDQFGFRSSNGNVVLSFFAEDSGFDVDAEDEFSLDSLIHLRNDLLSGDLRSLYLGWLFATEIDGWDEDELEPPAPPGLDELNPQLECLVDFFSIDPDRIAAAAEGCPAEPNSAPSPTEIREWVATLPVERKDEALSAIIADGNFAGMTKFRAQAVREMRAQRRYAAAPERPRRTVERLFARADAIADDHLRREREENDRREAERMRLEADLRRRHLESLRGRQGELWSEIDTLIATRQPNRYDAAVSTICDLRDLAESEDSSEAFIASLDILRRKHERKTALMAKLRNAGLWE